jgi:hypothetical protein
MVKKTFELWREMDLFGPETARANQLQNKIGVYTYPKTTIKV